MIEARFTEYVLMNKNIPVVSFKYNLATHGIDSFKAVYNLDYAPLGVLDTDGQIDIGRFNKWWQVRGIPASRSHLRDSMDELQISSHFTLAEKSHALSLSDRYWVNDVALSLDWDDINFFDNPFSDDVGESMLGYHPKSDASNLVSPNGSVNGVARKAWKIVNGERILYKESGGAYNQMAFNEVVASALCNRLFERDEYTPYDVCTYRNKVFSTCPNFLKENEELVPAAQIYSRYARSFNYTAFEHFQECCEQLELERFSEQLSKMFVVDFILVNQDRHLNNFGFLRNCETLEFSRIAPVFDTGSSLFYDEYTIPRTSDYCGSKPFDVFPKKQLLLFQDLLGWYDKDLLVGFTDEVASIFSKNPVMPEERIAQICEKIEKNIDDIEKIRSQKHFGIYSMNEQAKAANEEQPKTEIVQKERER